MFAHVGTFLLARPVQVANALPFFDELLAIIGGLLGGPICFLLPIAFWVGALERVRGDNTNSQRTMSPPSSSKAPALTSPKLEESAADATADAAVATATPYGFSAP